jgi:hypothetical protein
MDNFEFHECESQVFLQDAIVFLDIQYGGSHLWGRSVNVGGIIRKYQFSDYKEQEVFVRNPITIWRSVHLITQLGHR